MRGHNNKKILTIKSCDQYQQSFDNVYLHILSICIKFYRSRQYANRQMRLYVDASK